MTIAPARAAARDGAGLRARCSAAARRCRRGFRSIPVPSLSWLGIGRGAKKPGPLPAFDAKATARVDWQVSLGGKGGDGFAPAVRKEVIYAASPDGTDRQRRSGDRQAELAHQRRAQTFRGRGRRYATSSSSAPTRPTCSPSTPAASRCGTARSPARSPDRRPVAEGIVVVWSLDGKIFALATKPTARANGSTSARCRR